MKKVFLLIGLATFLGVGGYTASDLAFQPTQEVFQTDAETEQQYEIDADELSAEDASTTDAPSDLYPIVRTIDGDTIVVEIDGVEEKIRLIGIDTPESVHPDPDRNVAYGKIASAYTKDQLEGQQVALEFDVQERDRYGRLLAYVYLKDKMFNETLLEEGHAVVSTYPPNVKYVDRFVAREQQARERNLGLWAAHEATTNPVTTPSDATYVGNLSSHIFHEQSCASVGKMSSNNIVYIETREEAISDGYEPCKVCNP